MNKDINYTLSSLVPLLRMNGEKVRRIEAVHDWYKDGAREYMKEVAEITYDSGHRIYADIGCDSNLAACYDILAVILEIKQKSSEIDRIERDVYEDPPKMDMRSEDQIIRVYERNKAFAGVFGF